MTKDQHLEDQEQQYREDVAGAIAHDAAVLVQRGYSREQALAKAKHISDNQQEAESDPTGVLATLSESQSPTPPVGKGAKTAAIAADLRNKLAE